jgi:hypothetical protein
MAGERTYIGYNPQPHERFAPLAKVTRLLFGRIVPALFVLGGALFLVIGLRELYRGWTSESWLGVPETIIKSDVQAVRHPDSDGGLDTSYRVNVRYTYVVGDEEYTGTRMRFGAMGHNERSAAQEETERYSPGKEVLVFYDPKNPSLAVLTRGMGGGVWIAVGLGSVFLLIGTISFIYLPRVMAKRLTQTEM